MSFIERLNFGLQANYSSYSNTFSKKLDLTELVQKRLELVVWTMDVLSWQ